MNYVTIRLIVTTTEEKIFLPEADCTDGLHVKKICPENQTRRSFIIKLCIASNMILVSYVTVNYVTKNFENTTSHPFDILDTTIWRYLCPSQSGLSFKS